MTKDVSTACNNDLAHTLDERQRLSNSTQSYEVRQNYKNLKYSGTSNYEASEPILTLALHGKKFWILDCRKNIRPQLLCRKKSCLRKYHLLLDCFSQFPPIHIFLNIKKKSSTFSWVSTCTGMSTRITSGYLNNEWHKTACKNVCYYLVDKKSTNISKLADTQLFLWHFWAAKY